MLNLLLHVAHVVTIADEYSQELDEVKFAYQLKLVYIVSHEVYYQCPGFRYRGYIIVDAS